MLAKAFVMLITLFPKIDQSKHPFLGKIEKVMPLFNVSSLNKITGNNQKSDLTNQTKNEHSSYSSSNQKNGLW